MTATVASDARKSDLAGLVSELGPYPHAALTPGDNERKQSTRLLKVMCAECDYTVRVTTRALPGQSFEGRLTFIYPHLDQDTRTVIARFELENPGHKLRPGTSATVKTPLDQLHGLEHGGADIYLTEPLARGTLLSVIERLLKSGTAA